MLEKISGARVVFVTFALFLVCVIWAVPVRAQVSGATLAGVVADESGAGVPGANVTIKNVGMCVFREVTTNGDGFYSAPNLLPGNYDVTVSAKGFQTTVQKGVTLTVGATQ